MNAAVWVFRFAPMGTTSENRQSSLTGGLISGVHYKTKENDEEGKERLAAIRKRDEEFKTKLHFIGPITGELIIQNVGSETMLAIAKEERENEHYIEIGKKVAHLIYAGARKYVDVLRYQYGQHWIPAVTRYKKGSQLIGYLQEKSTRWFNEAEGNWWYFWASTGDYRVHITPHYSPNRPESQGISRTDWDDIATLCKGEYTPTVAARLLGQAHQLAERQEWRLCLIEVATALEAAVNQFLYGKVDPSLIPHLPSVQKGNILDRKGLTVVAATLAGATKDQIENAVQLIKLRNQYLHEGTVGHAKLSTLIYPTMQVVRQLLRGEVKKFCNYRLVSVRHGDEEE